MTVFPLAKPLGGGEDPAAPLLAYTGHRRPPPDVSLFYAAKPVPPGTDGVHQGQTLYCDATAAYNALPAEGKARARLHYRFVLLLIQFIPDLQNRIGASNP